MHARVMATDVEVRPRRFARGTRELKRIETTCVAVEAERMLENEVAEIVHDLKNPLYAITLEAALLEDKLQRGDRATGLHSLRRIERNVAFLDRLVLDLLDVCALATGHFQLSREPTDLRALVAGVCHRVTGERVVLDASRPVRAMVDPLRVERVIANLIDNALKYTPASSGIVVRLTECSKRARVSVVDTGPGIAASELAYVFDRYRRAATSGRKSGYGLGLYVCKRIVEAHGGRICVESIQGVGSHFFFELPI